ncbi:MAG: Gfo/Idh/MocA family oxidoreductase [Bacillota bacterium]|nr:Gfo/Idh/MocA family oxidoreductase [Bacillota bacterium]
MSVYKVGIIGFGGMASHHLNTASLLDFIEFKGVYDINPQRMEVAKEKGLYTYSSTEEMLNDPEINIVLVAVPNHLHKDLCIKALRAGKHVLCEKPVTLSSKELLEIMKVSHETGLIFTIDQNRRVNKDFVLLKQSIESGILGDVYVIESRVEGSRGMPEGWRCIKEQGGGMMLDWGVHLIDQILYMCDSKVVNVFCKMYSIHYDEIDDNFRLTITFENGLTAQVEVATNNFIKHPRWFVTGSEGTLIINDWDCSGQIVRCKVREDKWGAEIQKVKAGPSKTMAPRSPETIETIELKAPTDVIDNVQPTYIQMVNAIEGKAELTIKPEEALRVMKVMEAAFESAKTGQAIFTDI